MSNFIHTDHFGAQKGCPTFENGTNLIKLTRNKKIKWRTIPDEKFVAKSHAPKFLLFFIFFPYLISTLHVEEIKVNDVDFFNLTKKNDMDF